MRTSLQSKKNTVLWGKAGRRQVPLEKTTPFFLCLTLPDAVVYVCCYPSAILARAPVSYLPLAFSVFVVVLVHLRHVLDEIAHVLWPRVMVRKCYVPNCTKRLVKILRSRPPSGPAKRERGICLCATEVPPLTAPALPGECVRNTPSPAGTRVAMANSRKSARTFSAGAQASL